MPTERMRVADLHVFSNLQSRADGVCKETAAEYAAAARAGAVFPPLVAYRITDRKFPKPVSLVAGFHRLAAYKSAGVEECEVEVHTGTYAEAWLASWVSNLANGLRYTNADKRAAAATALKLFRDLSAAAVAEKLNVSDEFVRKVRKELVASGQLDAVEKTVGKDGRQLGDKHVAQKPVLSQPLGEDASQNDDEPTPAVESRFVEQSDAAVAKLADPEPTAVESVVNYGTAGKCRDAAKSIVRHVKQIRELYSGLMAGDYAAFFKDIAARHHYVTPSSTGELLKAGAWGTVDYGIGAFTCDALDELYRCATDAMAEFDRLDNQPVQARGQAATGPDPWAALEPDREAF